MTALVALALVAWALSYTARSRAYEHRHNQPIPVSTASCRHDRATIGLSVEEARRIGEAALLVVVLGLAITVLVAS